MDLEQINKLIKKGILVCPLTKKRLMMDQAENRLCVIGEERCYDLLTSGRSAVPVLLNDQQFWSDYALSSERMNKEYGRQHALAKIIEVVRRFFRADFRTAASRRAFKQVFHENSPELLIISIGGGPSRTDDRLINLNIAPFDDVDLVADAHALPFADASIDGLDCAAVLEHLANPHLAVKEMFRVLKPGGKVFAVTPFMQAYHGYPHHYQNFTLTGHELLFKAVGFRLIESGTCVGPVFALVNLTKRFLAEYMPWGIRHLLILFWAIIGYIIIKPLDLIVNVRPNAHVLASTTFVLAEKER